MQPLISPVDHETRRSSVHRDEESEIQPTESMPLINRFPEDQLRPRNLVTIITVGFLITILLAGIIIGIYLLILQSESENILPPIDDDTVLSKPHWKIETSNDLQALNARCVAVTQTDTRQCLTLDDCMTLVKEIQISSNNSTLPYNFLISTNGLTLEALGWNRTILEEGAPSLVVTFIGNFTEVPPSQLQIDAFNNLLTRSITRHSLAPEYSIIGRNSKYTPTKLFEALSHLPQWKKEDNKR